MSAPAVVWIVDAEHWAVPGLHRTVVATEEAAIAKAVEETGSLVEQHNKLQGSAEFHIEEPRAETWQHVVGLLQETYGAQFVYVDIDRQAVQP